MPPTDFLSFRKVGLFSTALQICLVVILYVITTLVGYAQFKQTGMMFGYPVSISILFVPIYEEMMFRGWILAEAEKRLSWPKAIAVTSVLFALWHLKNLFFLPPDRVAFQMAYTGLIISPILSYLTLKTKTIWPAVILHYVNNIAVPVWVLVMNIK